jgi:hypothetical protein
VVTVNKYIHTTHSLLTTETSLPIFSEKSKFDLLLPDVVVVQNLYRERERGKLEEEEERKEMTDPLTLTHTRTIFKINHFNFYIYILTTLNLI